MKASVIIPAHNEEETITATLAAIFNQDHPNFEVIIIDNASTDRTADVVRRFAKENNVPITIVREERKGTLWACEAGRCVASGDVIVRIDADCLPEKDWLLRGMRPFRDSNVAAVSGPYDYFDSPEKFRRLSLYTQKYIYTSVNALLGLLRTGGIMIGGNSFMRASALESAGGFNTSLVFYGDDTDTAKRMSSKGKVIFHPSLTMKTSARRFRSEGSFRLTAKYLYHFFATLFRRS